MPFYLPDTPTSTAVMHSLPMHRIEDQEGRIYNHSQNTFVEPVHAIKPNLERKWSRRENKPFEAITPEDRERLASASFVRRYTAFAVTYYSEEPKQLRGQYTDSQIAPNAAADIRLMANVSEIKHRYPQGFDLQQWVAQGKLHWLDLEQPDLPLKSSPADQFPYSEMFDLPGNPGAFTYHKGLFTWSGMRTLDKSPD